MPSHEKHPRPPAITHVRPNMHTVNLGTHHIVDETKDVVFNELLNLSPVRMAVEEYLPAKQNIPSSAAEHARQAAC